MKKDAWLPLPRRSSGRTGFLAALAAQLREVEKGHLHPLGKTALEADDSCQNSLSDQLK
jgi:hypothetical protein